MAIPITNTKSSQNSSLNCYCQSLHQILAGSLVKESALKPKAPEVFIPTGTKMHHLYSVQVMEWHQRRQCSTSDWHPSLQINITRLTLSFFLHRAALLCIYGTRPPRHPATPQSNFFSQAVVEGRIIP